MIRTEETCRGISSNAIPLSSCSRKLGGKQKPIKKTELRFITRLLILWIDLIRGPTFFTNFLANDCIKIFVHLSGRNIGFFWFEMILLVNWLCLLIYQHVVSLIWIISLLKFINFRQDKWISTLWPRCYIALILLWSIRAKLLLCEELSLFLVIALPV